MKRMMRIAILGLSLAPLTGCVIVPGHYGHGHWVYGHYDRYGYYHSGHWN